VPTWRTLTARITLFSGPTPSAPTISALDLYQKAWGSNPDNFQSGGNPLSVATAMGKKGGMTVSCSVQPLRVDFNFGPPPPSTDIPDLSFNLIEDAYQLHAEIVRINEFLETSVNLGSMSRVGTYIHFVREAASVEEANKLVTAVMPENYRARLTSEEDFVFQVNRPSTSIEVEGVRINCITKWSVDRFQVFSISVPPGGMPISDPRVAPFPQSHQFIASSVSFDNNNVPVRFPLSGLQQASLLRETLASIENGQRTMGLGVGGF
jgi:hypothetical protein